MNQNEHDKILAFDTLFTTNHIQMLKIVMPLFDPQLQKQLAVLIKYMEFQYTLSYYNTHPYPLCGCESAEKERSAYCGSSFGGRHFSSQESPDLQQLFSELTPYCTSEEKKKLEQISGLLRTMKMARDMMKTMETVKEMFPDGFAGGEGGGMDPSALAAMMSILGGTGSGGSEGGPDLSALAGMMGAMGGGAGNADGGPDLSSLAAMMGAMNTGSGDGNKPREPETGAASASSSESEAASSGGNGMMNMMMNMLTPEQKTMFEMFGGKL